MMEKGLYAKARSGEFRAFINSRYDTPALRQALAKIPLAFDRKDSRVIRDSRSTRAGFVKLDLGEGEKEFFLKMAKSRGFIYSLKRMFGRSRILRGFEMGVWLSNRDFPTPAPIVALEKRSVRRFITGFMLQKAEKNVTNFKDFGKYRLLHMERRPRNRFLGSLGRTLGRLHEMGVEHRDLKAKNLLVRESDGRFEIIFSDLDGARRVEVDAKIAARELGRLAYNFPARGFPWTDALRLLRSYLKARPSFKSTWTDLLWAAQREWRRFVRDYGPISF